MDEFPRFKYDSNNAFQVVDGIASWLEVIENTARGRRLSPFKAMQNVFEAASVVRSDRNNDPEANEDGTMGHTANFGYRFEHGGSGSVSLNDWLKKNDQLGHLIMVAQYNFADRWHTQLKETDEPTDWDDPLIQVQARAFLG